MSDALYLLKIHGNHSGQHNEMGLYFHGSNLDVDAIRQNAVDLVNEFNSAALGTFLNLMPSSYEVERLSAIRILPAGGIEYNLEFQDGFNPGNVGGGAASNQLCPVVRLIPPMGTKTAGKFFLPCIAESDIDGNVPTAGWLTNVNAFMNVILSNFSGSSIIWLSAVYSTKLNTYQDTIAYDTSSTVGFQKRRARPH